MVASLALGCLLAPQGARAADSPSCTGDVSADSVARKPGPALRFGIGPLVQAGQIGPVPSAAVPEQPARTDSALDRLRPAGGAFVLRLNRFFWSDGEAGFQRYLALVDRFTRRGYVVELQVRYHPSPTQEGDIAAWTRHVREVVRRFGSNPRVIGLQIANEVNFTFSADSSDGAYRGARDALVQGVIAAKDEARSRGYGQLGIGFNWAYRLDPAARQGRSGLRLRCGLDRPGRLSGDGVPTGRGAGTRARRHGQRDERAALLCPRPRDTRLRADEGGGEWLANLRWPFGGHSGRRPAHDGHGCR